MTWLYRIGFAVDSLATLYFTYLYISAAYFSRYASSAVSRPPLRGALIIGIVLGLSYFLHTNLHLIKIANILLWIPGIPLLGYGIFLGLALLIMGISKASRR